MRRFSCTAACRAVRRAGLELQVNFLVGLPWDTEETVGDTIRLADSLRADHVLYSVFTPYPGTQAFAHCRRAGLFGEDYDPTRLFPFSPATQFAPAIPADVFRTIVGRLWRLSDRRTRLYKVRHVISTNALRRLQEAGPRQAVRHATRILLGR